MDWLDTAILLFLASALIRGYRVGVIRQLFSALGTVAGFLAGAWLSQILTKSAPTVAGKFLLSMLILGVSVAISVLVFEYAGILLKSRIHNNAVNGLDRTLGSCAGAVAILAIVWLATPFAANIPSLMFRDQVNNSFIVSHINKTLPPSPSLISRIGDLISPNGFPQVFIGREPRISSTPTLPDLGTLNSGVQKDVRSIVKLEGYGCGGIVDGSGFVAAPELVVTNAHVVAGVAKPTIVDANGRHSAQAVWFDPELDVAILKATGLAGAPLSINGDIIDNGTPGAVLGFPGGGDFTAKAAVVLQSFEATGHDIYNQGSVNRSVYSLKADIQPGNSGGPLIDKNGKVIGLVFAQSTAYGQVGYALAMQPIVDALTQAKNHEVVSTQRCAE